MAWAGDRSEVNLQDNKLTITAFALKVWWEKRMTVPTESCRGQQGSSEGAGRRERKDPEPVVEAGEDLASGRVSSDHSTWLVTEEEVLHAASN